MLIHVGVTSVIAHIKMGQMHAALESKVLVVSAQGQSAEFDYTDSAEYVLNNASAGPVKLYLFVFGGLSNTALYIYIYIYLSCLLTRQRY